MKSLFIYFFSLTTIGLMNAQTWTWSAEMPKAGEMVTVDVKSLDVKDDFHVVSYSLQGKDLMATDVPYQVDHDGIHISLPVPSQTNWIRVVIKDEDNQVIAGDQKSVVKEGSPIKASMIEQALATSSYYRPMGLKRDEAASTALYHEAIQANPKWLEMPEVLRSYYNVAKASKSSGDLDQVKTYLLSINTGKNVGSQDLLIAAVRVSKDYGDSVIYQTLRKQLDVAYPQSLISQEDQLAKFNKAGSMEEKIAIRNQFKSMYTINDQNRTIWDQMTASLAQQSSLKQDWKQVETYVNEVMDPLYKAGQCNEYGWTLVGEGIEKPAPDLDAAARLSLASLNYLTPDLKKPPTLTKSEWKKNLDYTIAQYGDTYALILYKQGKYNEAVDHQSFAVKTSRFNDIEMNERYVLYLEKAGQKEELLSFDERNTQADLDVRKNTGSAL
jgi:tetratricopeptide (TPR) repeat protein